jgi:hypothetical protein
MWQLSAVIHVKAEVDDDGLVHIEGDEVSLVRWNHRPALLREALHCFGGMAVWKPRWYLARRLRRTCHPFERLPSIRRGDRGHGEIRSSAEV